MMISEPYLDTDEASKFLSERGFPTAPSTLAKYRCIGGGPWFVNFGRFPRYTPTWLMEWVQERTSAPKRSTSDAADAPAVL